jgi:hypothetical protein
MARTKLGMIAAAAAAAAAANPEPSSLPPVSKKRKRGFRLTMPKKKRRVFEGFDAFEVSLVIVWLLIPTQIK